MLFDVYMLSNPRYCAFRVVVLAVLSCSCSWEDAWKSAAALQAIDPFCGRRNCAFQQAAAALVRVLFLLCVQNTFLTML